MVPVQINTLSGQTVAPKARLVSAFTDIHVKQWYFPPNCTLIVDQNAWESVTLYHSSTVCLKYRGKRFFSTITIWKEYKKEIPQNYLENWGKLYYNWGIFFKCSRKMLHLSSPTSYAGSQT